MSTAFYPGSFDPIHNGHIAVVNSAAKIFETVVIGVGNNPAKTNYLLNQDERFSLASNCFSTIDNVKVIKFEGLTTEAAMSVSADCLIKGIRSGSDLDDEMLQAKINYETGNSLTTVFLPAINEFGLVSSTYLRQVTLAGGDLSKLVPVQVSEYLAERQNK